jgi:hypothetical protein
MFIELHRKSDGKAVQVDARKIITFNSDDDGQGTMLMLVGNLVRVVTESVDAVSAMLGKTKAG